jgi:hypothetical protein
MERHARGAVDIASFRDDPEKAPIRKTAEGFILIFWKQ